MLSAQFFRPFGNNQAKVQATTSTAAPVTFSCHPLSANWALYQVAVTGANPVSIEFAKPPGNPVATVATNSLTIPNGTYQVVEGPANANISVVSSAASSVTITPGQVTE
jgi:hypothetical protein